MLWNGCQHPSDRTPREASILTIRWRRQKVDWGCRRMHRAGIRRLYKDCVRHRDCGEANGVCAAQNKQSNYSLVTVSSFTLSKTSTASFSVVNDRKMVSNVRVWSVSGQRPYIDIGIRETSEMRGYGICGRQQEQCRDSS